MRKLDTNRTYGTISPQWQPPGFDRPAHYEQDNRFFDAHGYEVGKGIKAPTQAEIEQQAPAVPNDAAAPVEEQAPAPSPSPAIDTGTEYSPAELIVLADEMTQEEFVTAASEVLGDDLPDDADKADVLARLKEAVKAKRHPLDHDGDGRPGGSLPTEPITEPLPVSQLIAQADTMPWNDFQKHAKLVLGTTCPPGKRAIVEALIAAQAEHDKRQARHRSAPPPSAPPAPPASQAAPPAPQQPAAQPVNGTGVDLIAWARGQKDYLFSELQKEFREQHSKLIQERIDGLNFLIEQKLVTAAEARKDIHHQGVG